MSMTAGTQTDLTRSGRRLKKNYGILQCVMAYCKGATLQQQHQNGTEWEWLPRHPRGCPWFPTMMFSNAEPASFWAPRHADPARSAHAHQTHARPWRCALGRLAPRAKLHSHVCALLAGVDLGARFARGGCSVEQSVHWCTWCSNAQVSGGCHGARPTRWHGC